MGKTSLIWKFYNLENENQKTFERDLYQKNIKIKGWVNTTFRKTNESECQPDLAFYIGDKVKFPPLNNSPVNINELDAPTLVIEIAVYSVNDDLGFKRLLYERLGVKEYWIMDGNNNDIIAFEIIDGGSLNGWQDGWRWDVAIIWENKGVKK